MPQTENKSVRGLFLWKSPLYWTWDVLHWIYRSENDLRKRRRSLAWHEPRASRLKNFVLVSAPKRSAGRNYSGFGFQTASSVRNVAVQNITRFVDGTRSSAAPAGIRPPSRPGLPLTAWFWAIYLCATDKRGISAVQLSRTLNICYESAWYLLHGKWRGFVHADAGC